MNLVSFCLLSSLQSSPLLNGGTSVNFSPPRLRCRISSQTSPSFSHFSPDFLVLHQSHRLNFSESLLSASFHTSSSPSSFLSKLSLPLQVALFSHGVHLGQLSFVQRSGKVLGSDGPSTNYGLIYAAIHSPFLQCHHNLFRIHLPRSNLLDFSSQFMRINAGGWVSIGPLLFYLQNVHLGAPDPNFPFHLQTYLLYQKILPSISRMLKEIKRSGQPFGSGKSQNGAF